jgi:hypothetical protein
MNKVNDICVSVSPNVQREIRNSRFMKAMIQTSMYHPFIIVILTRYERPRSTYADQTPGFAQERVHILGGRLLHSLALMPVHSIWNMSIISQSSVRRPFYQAPIQATGRRLRMVGPNSPWAMTENLSKPQVLLHSAVDLIGSAVLCRSLTRSTLSGESVTNTQG